MHGQDPAKRLPQPEKREPRFAPEGDVNTKRTRRRLSQTIFESAKKDPDGTFRKENPNQKNKHLRTRVIRPKRRPRARRLRREGVALAGDVVGAAVPRAGLVTESRVEVPRRIDPAGFGQVGVFRKRWVRLFEGTPFVVVFKEDPSLDTGSSFCFNVVKAALSKPSFGLIQSTMPESAHATKS